MAAFMMPTLYACKPRTAFHVHTSHLLRTGIDIRHEITVPAASSVDMGGDMDLCCGPGACPTQAPDMQDAKSESSSSKKPKMCGEAIQEGLEEFNKGNYDSALDLFTSALELPGNGFMRMAGSPREYACPSEQEEMSALYNMACCYSKMQEMDSGIACIRGLLEVGFDDFETLRNDADLQYLRSSPEFEKLLDNSTSSTTGSPLGIKLPFGGGDKDQAATQQPRKKSWLDPW